MSSFTQVSRYFKVSCPTTTTLFFFYDGVSHWQNEAGVAESILNNKDSKGAKYFVLHITKEVSQNIFD